MDMQTSRGIPLRADPDSIRALSMRSLSRAASCRRHEGVRRRIDGERDVER